MKYRILRVVFIFDSGLKTSFKPCIEVNDIEAYRHELKEANKVKKIIIDYEQLA